MAYKQVNPIPQLNFQINRVLTYGNLACNHDEVVSVLAKVRNFEEWFLAWVKLAERAKNEHKTLHAA